ncbi:MAG: bifunctional UDP-N-acetylglucosamine diphosphorylase/glucosamine-1-phosphate N-acetyltransferase GlmU [Halieaceae bacterium]|jgi:bifunctional UDP-N-acetylglucosamine pyrophosphorylase/glucosamine-1-phosphate N-acetyltransferase|nr:bifunctional UDP-N-acetylglucosamine diphosphorylase/glucosamine-1-phosphate N-acetyltransferase GlmU [Halieaceae bacterium]
MKLDIVILAAGEGKRMQSMLPKVLHQVGGIPLLQHVLNSAGALSPVACHVVVGHGSEQVREALAGRNINWVLQDKQLGTGHAVMQALPYIHDDATVLVLYGDVPLISADTLKGLLAQATTGPALLTARVNDPQGYGRILRTKKGRLTGVVEERDATAKERLVNEVNTGILAAPAHHLKQLLPQVGNNNAQGEYYLPDIVSLALREGIPVSSATAPSEIEMLGVNDRVQLNRVEREYQRRLAAALLQAGTGVADASRLDIRGSLDCGRDVFIDVNCLFEGANTLGDGVKVGANCVLINCSIGAGTEIKPFTHMEGVATAANCVIGPFARLRPDTRLAEAVRIGNFVETKKSELGAGSKVNHLSYIGDTQMGEGVNIGAGTITCNYDGANKHRTEIGNGVFVGSNSTLVAPVAIEDGGFVGAGSTITKTVAGDQLAISRARQRNLDGWKRPEKQASEQPSERAVDDTSEGEA